MNEEIIECKNENAIYAMYPAKATAGKSNQTLEKPAKLKPTILNPGTTKVTMYSTATAATHLNKPKVIKLTGKSKTLITGLAIKDATVNPSPVKRSVSMPFEKTIPEAIDETKNIDTESITKCLNILFIELSIKYY